MLKQFHANQARLRRHQRIRSHLTGTEIRPRLNIFRSGAQIYAQVIDDTTGKTLSAAAPKSRELQRLSLIVAGMPITDASQHWPKAPVKQGWISKATEKGKLWQK